MCIELPKMLQSATFVIYQRIDGDDGVASTYMSMARKDMYTHRLDNEVS